MAADREELNESVVDISVVIVLHNSNKEVCGKKIRCDSTPDNDSLPRDRESRIGHSHILEP